MLNPSRLLYASTAMTILPSLEVIADDCSRVIRVHGH
jgi:hypothetical protein